MHQGCQHVKWMFKYGLHCMLCTEIFNIRILEGSVVTHLRWDENVYDGYTQNFVKKNHASESVLKKGPL